MCQANMDALITEVRHIFKEQFDFDILDEHITEGEDGIEVDYDDFDTGRIDDYNECEYVEDARIEYDGRASYIRVHAVISYDDVLGAG